MSVHECMCMTACMCVRVFIPGPGKCMMTWNNLANKIHVTPWGFACAQERDTLLINLGGDATLDPTSSDANMKTLRLRDQTDSPLRDFITPDQKYDRQSGSSMHA